MSIEREKLVEKSEKEFKNVSLDTKNNTQTTDRGKKKPRHARGPPWRTGFFAGRRSRRSTIVASTTLSATLISNGVSDAAARCTAAMAAQDAQEDQGRVAQVTGRDHGGLESHCRHAVGPFGGGACASHC